MTDVNDTTSLQEQLVAHRERLATLLRQVAIHGASYAPPAQISGIAEARREIAQLKAALRDAGVVIQDEIGDVALPQATASAPMFARPQMARLTLLLEGDVQRFTPEEQASCIFLLSRAVNIALEDIRIVYIGSGSIKLVVELPEDAATRLTLLHESNNPVLQKLRILAMHRQLPATEQNLAELPPAPVIASVHAARDVNIATNQTIFNVSHHPQQPRPTIDPAEAQQLLDRLPLDTTPDPALLPPGSRMQLLRNPLFVGREADLKAIAKNLKGGGAAAITTGIGGVGKTQLASEFAHRYGQFFAGGVFWLSFADPTGIDAEIAACGGVGAMELYTDAHSLTQAEQVAKVRAEWALSIPRLLIFDNCDDLPGTTAETLLAQRMPKSGGCRILVTSRRGQWPRGLGIAALPLSVLSRAESIALLRSHRGDISDDEVDAIANELGDLPLALSLAGSYLETYRDETFGAPNTYLANLQKQLLDHRSMQGAGAGPSLTGHELNVRATFNLSYQRLDTAEPIDALAIDALARAAYLAPGEPFPRELLLATLGDRADDEETAARRADALRRLHALGLLEQNDDDYVRLHPLLAIFAQELDSDSTAQIAVIRFLRGAVSHTAWPTALRRTAAFQLLRLHGLIDGGPISSVELLACLDLTAPFVAAPTNHLHLIEAITTHLDTSVVDIFDRQHVQLLVYRAMLQGKLSEIEDEPTDFRIQEASRDYDSAGALNEKIIQTQSKQETDQRVRARIKLGAANLRMHKVDKMPTSADSPDKQRLLLEAVELYLTAAEAARAYNQDIILEAMVYKELSYTYSCLERWPGAEEYYNLALDTLKRGSEYIADSQAYVRQHASTLETASEIHFAKGLAISTGPDSSLALEEYIMAYNLAQDEITLLQQASRNNLRLIVAYINAGDYLKAMSKCVNCPIPEATRKATAYWQTAHEEAHRLGLSQWEDEARKRFD
jgi:hypothetical protein